MLCSSTPKHRPSRQVTLQKAITGHSSKALCRVTSSLSQAWMGPGVWMGISRFGTKTGLAQGSTTQPNMRRPVETIKSTKMFTAASGMPSTARLQWSVNRSMKTGDRSMTAIMSAPFLRKPCVIRAHRPAMVPPNPVSRTMDPVRLFRCLRWR